MFHHHFTRSLTIALTCVLVLASASDTALAQPKVGAPGWALGRATESGYLFDRGDWGLEGIELYQSSFQNSKWAFRGDRLVGVRDGKVALILLKNSLSFSPQAVQGLINEQRGNERWNADKAVAALYPKQRYVRTKKNSSTRNVPGKTIITLRDSDYLNHSIERQVWQSPDRSKYAYWDDRAGQKFVKPTKVTTKGNSTTIIAKGKGKLTKYNYQYFVTVMDADTFWQATFKEMIANASFDTRCTSAEDGKLTYDLIAMRSLIKDPRALSAARVDKILAKNDRDRAAAEKKLASMLHVPSARWSKNQQGRIAKALLLGLENPHVSDDTFAEPIEWLAKIDPKGIELALYRMLWRPATESIATRRAHLFAKVASDRYLDPIIARLSQPASAPTAHAILTKLAGKDHGKTPADWQAWRLDQTNQK